MERPEVPGQPPTGGSNPLARLSALTGNANPSAAATPSGNGTTPAPVARPAAAERRLGRLEHVTADTLWSTDGAFARWLADNLDAIGETVSLPLRAPELVDGDVPVILAATEGGKSAVILPQRGASGDDAFGALVRHFAASAAAHAVWICGAPSSEHAAAVSWLNRAVDGRFVMVKVQAVTIGDSAAAPTFELTVRPSRADDPGVESTTPDSKAATGERRADDWVGELRKDVTSPAG